MISCMHVLDEEYMEKTILLGCAFIMKVVLLQKTNKSQYLGLGVQVEVGAIT